MGEMLSQSFVVNALIVSTVLGLLLSYMGVHVVGRGIVFVDLALGQISMLGVAFAGFNGGGQETLISIVFTMLGAFLLSFIKVKDKRLKHEAIIGIVYAVASAGTVLLISKTPHGESDISEVLFGSLFTVTTEQIITLSIVFAIIGIVQLVFRKKFFELTEQFENRQVEHMRVFDLWNFLFYLCIGLCIVFAVRVAGVIPVFSYLIVPPVAAVLFSQSRNVVVGIAMLISVLGGFLGIYSSVSFDFPAGSSVVAALGALFVAVALLKFSRFMRLRFFNDNTPPDVSETSE
ncbi:MAG: metal ABC transporter permease [Ignavibacteriales bacterium]|nr:metal ABC transporter permease [Ignavibacteriales bacterium]